MHVCLDTSRTVLIPSTRVSFQTSSRKGILAGIVLLLSAVLGTGFLSTRLAQVLRIPHSVLLVLIGMLAGWLARGAGLTLPPEAWHHFPEVVLYVLLPPLVFDSAYHLDVEELRRDRWPLLFLAVPAL